MLENHGDALYAYARSRVDNDDDIADCIQETLLAAVKNAAQFAGRSSERTWLIGILKFKIIDLYRARAREIQFQSIDDADDDGAFNDKGHWEMQRAPKAWEKSPLEDLEVGELSQKLHECIRHLPAAMRTALVLRELEAIATTEICKQLNITATNLNVILYRARLHLRSCLETAGFTGVHSG